MSGAHQKLKESLTEALKDKGIDTTRVHLTDFGRGEHGITIPIHAGKSKSLVSEIHLIQRKDGTWRKKVTIPTWLDEMIDSVGFGEAE